MNGNSGFGEVGTENRRTVGIGKNGLVHIDADFALVDIEGRNDLDIARFVPANLPMHQANGILRGLFPVVVDALYQRTGAVSNSNNSDSYIAHDFLGLLYILSINAFFSGKIPLLRLISSRTRLAAISRFSVVSGGEHISGRPARWCP